MPAVRRILGHVSVEIAAAKRKCHRNSKHHKISKGEACLVIRDSSGSKKNYCGECAPAILDIAQTDLDEIADRLAP
ncbi:MAG: hypothetical protein GY946_24305 [bacterium]|nr:hypothetical protein [bacterium]